MFILKKGLIIIEAAQVAHSFSVLEQSRAELTLHATSPSTSVATIGETFPSTWNVMLKDPRTQSGSALGLPACIKVVTGASCTGSVEAWKKPSPDNAYNFEFRGKGNEQHLFCIVALRSFKHGGLVMTHGGGLFSELTSPSASDPLSLYSGVEVPVGSSPEYYFGTSATTMTVNAGEFLVVQKLKQGTREEMEMIRRR
eukprot:scaffold5517_cov135-Cylindrotheca_fusiformis.AAC.50